MEGSDAAKYNLVIIFVFPGLLLLAQSRLSRAFDFSTLLAVSWFQKCVAASFPRFGAHKCMDFSSLNLQNSHADCRIPAADKHISERHPRL